MANLSLVFDLLARDRASKEFDKVGDAAQRAGKKAGSGGGGFGGMVSGGMKLAAGALVGAGIVSTFTGLYDAAAESAKIGRLTANVIKQTGAAAGVTADQVGQLATSLSQQTGQDDEAIQSAENLLLTFTNVKNAAGAGNDVFNRTTALALDMSTALGTDASGAAMQLGKALNNPVKGVGALARAGVSFTAQQKEQIKTLVASGDTLGAQRIILDEVGKEFGGAAAAAATPMDRLKVTAGNLQEQIGAGLIPVFSKVAGVASQAIGVLFSGDFTGGGPLMEDGPVVAGLFAIRDGAIALFGYWRAVVLPQFVAVGQAALGTVQFFRQHQAAAVALGVVVGGVLAVVTAAWIAQGAVSVANSIRSVAAWFATATASTTSATIQSRSTAQIVVGWLLAGARAALGAARVVAGWVLMGVQSMLQAARMAAAWFIALGPIGWVTAAVIGIVALVVANWSKVKTWTVNAWHAVVGAVVGAWHSLTSAVSSGVAAAVSFVSGLPGRILGALGSFGSLLYNSGRSMIQGLINGAGSLLRNIGRFFLNMVPGWIRGPFEHAMGISSPSKVFRGYGINIGQGLIRGLTGSRKDVQTASAKLADDLVKAHKAAIKKGDWGSVAKLHAAYVTLSTRDDALVGLAKRRDAIAKDLEAARDRLADAVKMRNDFRVSVRDAAAGYADVTKLDAGNTAGGIVAEMGRRLAAIRTFRTNLAKLARSGLSNTVYQQIAAAGVEGGGQTAAALARGGPAAVRQVNAVSKQITAASRGLGADATKRLYQAGVDAATGLVNGLKARSSALKTAAESLAETLTAAIKRKLGIRSPSAVFAGVGQNIGAGLAAGIASTRPAVASELARLADTSALAGLGARPAGLGYRPPGYDTARTAPAAAAGATYVTTVSGVASPEQVAAAVTRAQRTTEFLAGGAA